MCFCMRCVNANICGPVERVQLEPESVSERRMTRHALQQLGAALAETTSGDNVIAPLHDRGPPRRPGLEQLSLT